MSRKTRIVRARMISLNTPIENYEISRMTHVPRTKGRRGHGMDFESEVVKSSSLQVCALAIAYHRGLIHNGGKP